MSGTDTHSECFSRLQFVPGLSFEAELVTPLAYAGARRVGRQLTLMLCGPNTNHANDGSIHRCAGFAVAVVSCGLRGSVVGARSIRTCGGSPDPSAVVGIGTSPSGISCKSRRVVVPGRSEFHRGACRAPAAGVLGSADRPVTCGSTRRRPRSIVNAECRGRRSDPQS